MPRSMVIARPPQVHGFRRRGTCGDGPGARSHPPTRRSHMANPIQPRIRTRADEPEVENEVRPAEFREAAAFWATGVAVLAAADGDDVEAITLTAFAPLSAEPPLVLASVGNDAAVLYVIE